MKALKHITISYNLPTRLLTLGKYANCFPDTNFDVFILTDIKSKYLTTDHIIRVLITFNNVTSHSS